MDIKDQNKLLLSDKQIKTGIKTAVTAVEALTPTTLKKVREKIQKIKVKKKRGPRDE